jgi:NADPH2:quinone reductase
MGLGPIVASTSSSDPVIIQSLKDDGADIVTTHGNLELGLKVDIIIENLANANLGIDLKLLTTGGRVIVVGSRGEVTINPRDLMRCEGIIHGMVGAGSFQDKVEADEAIQKGIESGKLIPRIGSVFTLENIGHAHDEVINRTSCIRGKVIVRI